MVAANCPRCSSVVALYEGRPVVTSSGTIEVWHARCWSEREMPVAVEAIETIPIPVVTPRELIADPLIETRVATRLPRKVVMGALAATVIATAIACLGFVDREPTSTVVSIEMPVIEPQPRLRSAIVTHDEIPVAPKVTKPKWIKIDETIPKDKKGRGLDEVYPSIVNWVHPITSASELLPWNPARHFGAERSGIERSDCGAGHCGVDLDGPRGRAVISVESGVVVRVERRESGGDGMSGRFVRVQHEDGYLTSYFHMDTIDPKLEPGDRVARGQYIGTIGSTGVAANAPHLHFSLELPIHAKYKGDLPRSATRFTNPAPFLVRSKVIDEPVRRPLKPAF